MKVVHICQRDDAATGGAVRVAAELMKRLPGLGIEVRCLFVYGGPGRFAAELPGQCDYLKGRPGRGVAANLLALAKYLARERPDIIHHHDGLTWTHLVTVLWRPALKVGHAHLGFPRPQACFRHRLAGWMFLRAYHRLFGVSEATSQTWVQAGMPEASVSRLPNGVDVNVFKPASAAEREAARKKFGLPMEAKVVCFVGRLDTVIKGVDDYIRVIAALPSSYWGLVVGTGPDEPELQLMAAESGAGERIRFVGLQEETGPCYHASDLFLMTSRHESFGLVVLEAAACGLGVFGYEVGGGGAELLEALNIPVLKERDAAVMAERVQAWCKNAHEQASVCALRREKVVSNYSWDPIAVKVAECYAAWLREIRAGN
ncbi:MAG: glycosyltransferase family 4 protein [Verrucomicrobiota bacterium]